MTKAIASTFIVLLLALGLALIGYARWTDGITDADAALADGRYDEAIAGYQVAESRFDRVPALRQLVSVEFDRASANHLMALCRLRRYDEVIDLAQKAPPGAQPHFWAGTALFHKAVVEEHPEARFGWLSRAEEEFRKAVESSPDDWNTKYDYELTTRLAAELRKQPNTPPKQLMQLLRPPTTGQKTPRKVG